MSAFEDFKNTLKRIATGYRYNDAGNTQRMSREALVGAARETLADHNEPWGFAETTRRRKEAIKMEQYKISLAITNEGTGEKHLGSVALHFNSTPSAAALYGMLSVWLEENVERAESSGVVGDIAIPAPPPREMYSAGKPPGR